METAVQGFRLEARMLGFWAGVLVSHWPGGVGRDGLLRPSTKGSSHHLRMPPTTDSSRGWAYEIVKGTPGDLGRSGRWWQTQVRSSWEHEVLVDLKLEKNWRALISCAPPIFRTGGGTCHSKYPNPLNFQGGPQQCLCVCVFVHVSGDQASLAKQHCFLFQINGHICPLK